jgi:hypothetical protein
MKWLAKAARIVCGTAAASTMAVPSTQVIPAKAFRRLL